MSPCETDAKRRWARSTEVEGNVFRCNALIVAADPCNNNSKGQCFTGQGSDSAGAYAIERVDDELRGAADRGLEVSRLVLRRVVPLAPLLPAPVVPRRPRGRRPMSVRRGRRVPFPAERRQPFRNILCGKVLPSESAFSFLYPAPVTAGCELSRMLPQRGQK
jgi:hypothetical protein